MIIHIYVAHPPHEASIQFMGRKLVMGGKLTGEVVLLVHCF